MMTETTDIRYGHGPNGMTELTFNEKALDRWAKNLHISSIVEKKPTWSKTNKNFKRCEPSQRRGVHDLSQTRKIGKK